jgi:spore maturation protein CgeB
MKIYIANHPSDAGYWIYRGLNSAWQNQGFDIVDYKTPSEINTSEEYDIMINDSMIKSEKDLEIISNSRKAYVFVQPNKFPKHWGNHPNFVTQIKEENIEPINKMDNTCLWTFSAAAKSNLYYKWKKVNTVFLAFDSINYKPIENSQHAFDLCFIGGWANNGFNEKRKIMLEHFSKIKNLNLNVGFFINRNLTGQEEADILYNSKIALNLHDQYQRELGFDINERTYKSLGLNGFCISDSIRELENQFPDVPTAKDSDSYLELIKHYLNKDLEQIKKRNRQMILENHTYISRVKQFMEL